MLCSSGAAKPSDTVVCVTGATGYLGGHVVKQLLEAGYTVRGTTRASTRAKYPAKLKKLTDLPGGNERLSWFDANLTDAASFEKAFDGCHCIMHTASPFFFENMTYDNMVKVAISGTESVLKTAAAKGVKKVVLTSSTVAVYCWFGDRNTTDDLTKPLTEEDWGSEEKMKENKTWYMLSKQLAEKRAWELAKELDLQLAVMNPDLIIGPILGKSAVTGADGKEASKMNTSIDTIAQMFDGRMKKLFKGHRSIVDVRDVARGHVQALRHGKCWGKRHPMLGHCPFWVELAGCVRNALRKLPGRKPELTVPKDTGENWFLEFMGTPYPDKTKVDPSIAERMGIEYTPLQKTLDDTIESLAKHYPSMFYDDVDSVRPTAVASAEALGTDM